MSSHHISNSEFLSHCVFPPGSTEAKKPMDIPDGIKSILNACYMVYPTQTNPIQVMAQVKLWQGGPHPLDYVSIYYHESSKGLCTPHWHYVSMGLSDLHGDGRVHDRRGESCDETMSGYGFELSFRVKVETDRIETPPIWPVELLQSLASCIFHSHANFKPGDFITWNNPLDNSPDCILTQMFLVEDLELPVVKSKSGLVSFFQIVAATMEELNAAQSWNVMGVVSLMRESMLTGGHYQVCDNKRTKTLYQINPEAMLTIKDRLKSEGNNFSGFSTECYWSETIGHSTHNVKSNPLDSTHTNNSELIRIKQATITLCADAFLLFPLVLRGRLQHGKLFTFRCPNNEIAITLVPEEQDDSFVTAAAPFVAKSSWLHVYTPVTLISELLAVADTFYSEHKTSPKDSLHKIFSFPAYSLVIRVQF